MDTATREALDKLKDEITNIRTQLHCPMDGCRYLESKGRIAGNVANWISAVSLLVFIGVELVGSL